MSNSTPVYHQLLTLLGQYSQYKDLRHLKALAWMINALPDFLTNRVESLN